jgi:hypothetical protein
MEISAAEFRALESKDQKRISQLEERLERQIVVEECGI